MFVCFLEREELATYKAKATSKSVHLDRLPAEGVGGGREVAREERGRPAVRRGAEGRESRSVAARVPAAAQPGRERVSAQPAESVHREMTQFLRDWATYHLDYRYCKDTDRTSFIEYPRLRTESAISRSLNLECDTIPSMLSRPEYYKRYSHNGVVAAPNTLLLFLFYYLYPYNDPSHCYNTFLHVRYTLRHKPQFLQLPSTAAEESVSISLSQGVCLFVFLHY